MIQFTGAKDVNYTGELDMADSSCGKGIGTYTEGVRGSTISDEGTWLNHAKHGISM